MSIVRIGLAENKGFADNYDAIFGKGKKKAPAAAPKPVVVAKTAMPAAKAKGAVKAKPVAAVKKTTATAAKKPAAKKK